MSTLLDPWGSVLAEIEAAAQDNSLSPEARLMKLAVYRDDLNDMLGRVDTYRGDLGLVQEGRDPAYREAVMEAREDANVRRILIERELSTGVELDALGYPSHEDIDRLDEEGLLEAWLAESGRIEEGLWDEIKHPRGRGGKFSDVLGRVIAHKGRSGKASGMPTNVPRPTAVTHEPGSHVIAGGKPGRVEKDHGDGQVTVHHYGDDTHLTHRADEVVPHPHPDEEPVINVGNDVERAVELLGQGHRIELNQPHQVSTLLDKLASVVQEAQAKGDDAPNFDLCKVSVKGTNLFCAQSKGIPRLQMPQFKGNPAPGSKADKLPKDENGYVDISQQFREHLQTLGVKITPGQTRADHLRASQSELNGAMVARIAKEMEAGRKDDDPIFTSRDDYILDGHHRWAAKVGVTYGSKSGGDMSMNTDQIDMPMTDLFEEAKKFTAGWGMATQNTDDPTIKQAESSGLDEYPKQGPMAQQLLGGAADTKDKHTVAVRGSGGTRVYTSERQALHDKIIDSLLRKRQPVVNSKGDTEMHPNPLGESLQPPPSGAPKVLFMAGGTASGKSSALALPENADVVPKDAVHVDPDEIKAMLPEYVQMVQAGDKFAASGVHEESSDISKRLLAEGMKRGLNIVRDGTGNSPNPRKFAGQIEEMRKSGYEPHLLYVNAPTDVAVKRMIGRAKETGRYVPVPEVKSQHLNVSKNFEHGVRPLVENGTVHSFRMYDTENEPRLIASGGNGSLSVHEPGLFQRFLDKSHEG